MTNGEIWAILAGFFAALSAALSLACLTRAISAARDAKAATGLPARALSSLTSRIESLEVSRDDQATAMTDLANRLKMIRVRSAANHASKPDGDPDPYKEPERWRTVMNERLARSRVGGP